jgi:dCTP diphosphatase
MTDHDDTIAALKALVAKFRDEREWSQFHNPKDLAASISIEAAELLELFQWKDTAELDALLADPAQRQHVEEEVADVVVYCLNMSDTVGFDLAEAIKAKLRANAEKYPVDKARGSAKKYTEI